MCGICGIVYQDPEARVEAELVRRMMGAIAHRGPDGQGEYVFGRVGLGHLRLAIIDLSAGAQPMTNEDGTVWIVFNGEIYNYQELRQDLLRKGHKFTSASDTEVIVHLYEEYGVECLAKLRGMFAFAIWNQKDQSLFVARDRLGIKPLYYTNDGKKFSFASEMKALLVDPDLRREVNLHAIDRFLSYSYLPGEDTLLRGIQKLEPGHYIIIDGRGKLTKQRYWDLNYQQSSEYRTVDEAAAALTTLLEETVRLHMISDVPVGFLLSGGVDSTGLLSYAVHQTDKEIQTFTVGFDGQNFADERPYARLAAKKFGTRHHEISMTADDFRDFLPRYVWHMEEPVCEPPAIALYYISKLAREHVTVLLSGEGGDEAFGGYPEYRHFPMLESLKSGLGPLRELAGMGLGTFGRLAGSSRAAKYAPLFNAPLAEYYMSRASSPFSYFNESKRALYTSDFFRHSDGAGSAEILRQLFGRVADKDLLSQMLYVDTKTWLPDDLLIKADKITMANSLELRVPLLDHKLMEFAASLPSGYKVKGKLTKRVLKQAFAGHIPEEIIKRKKTGFPVPYGRWLNHELKSYVHDLLLSQKAVGRGLFQRNAVEGLLNKSGADGSNTKEIFSLVVLELWHQQFMDAPAAPRASQSSRLATESSVTVS